MQPTKSAILKSIVLAGLFIADLTFAQSSSGPRIYGFTTMAGHPGGAGTTDGAAANARFHLPSGVAADADGNVFVADTGNSTIRKIAPDGTVSTFAGAAGQYGAADGPGPGARFGNPGAVAVDAAGNVYVADSGNNTIRKITPGGTVSTFVGASAGLSEPGGVAVDAANNVYVADSGNSTIRKITPDGAVSTLAGVAGVAGSTDGKGTNALFNYPPGLAVDAAGNVYVADGYSGTIRKISPDGSVTTVAGQPGGGGWLDAVGTNARFNHPYGVAVDKFGNVFVADSQNSAIRKILPDGTVSTVAGISPSSEEEARFNQPPGVAVDGVGNVYVADANNNVICKITPDGAVQTLAGAKSQLGSADGLRGNARFDGPGGLAVDSAGNVYVADQQNSEIRKITPDGAVSTIAGQPDQTGGADGLGSLARFNWPGGAALDGAGNLFVADSLNFTLRKIGPDGSVTTFAGALGKTGAADGTGGAARFAGPTGLAADGAGNLYVTDGGATLRKVTPAGLVTTLAGLAGHAGHADGVGTNASFNGAAGPAVDGAGNIYVADRGNHTIRKIAPDGTVSTLAGVAGQAGAADGAGSSARFNTPWGVAVDAAGNVYVADEGNFTIRQITPDGVVSTIGGRAGNSQGVIDGLSTNAGFGGPTGIAVDSVGNLYVSDAGTSVRKGTPAGPSGPPVITIQPVNRTVPLGADVVFAVAAEGAGGLSFQWRDNGAALPGATNATLSLPNVSSATAGSYDVIASGGGSSTSSVAVLSVESAAAPSYTFMTVAGLAGGNEWWNGTGTEARFDNFNGDISPDGQGGFYLLDSGFIRHLAPDGTVTTPPAPAGTFRYLNGIAADGQGELYVADSLANVIWKINPNGATGLFAGTPGQFGSSNGPATAAQFYYPSGLAFDAAGNLYVMDRENSAVRKITAGGVVSTLAANFAFQNTTSLAVDPAGNVYVPGASAIWKITPTGVDAVLAGAQGQPGAVDGAGTNARFAFPAGVAVDAAGNVYVADSANNTIRKVTPDGRVTTIGGLAGQTGSADGAGPAARFNNPMSLAVDSAGNVWVADNFNDAIRLGVPAPKPPQIVNQPLSQTNAPGSAVVLSAQAAGTPPFGFQWLKNGLIIPGATNALFQITNAGVLDDGTYTVVVSNASGSLSSAPATLLFQLPGVTPPSLQITAANHAVALFFPTSATGYVVETSAALGDAASWAVVTNAVVAAGGQLAVTNAAAAPAAFYRLRR